MPQVTAIIPEVHKTVIRPIVHDVVKDLIKVLRIDDKKTPIEYRGNAQNLAPRNSTLDAEELNTFNTNQRVIINVSDEYVDRAVMSSDPRQQDNPVVFRDAAMRVTLYPVKHTREFSVDIILHAPDRVTAGRWIRNLRSLIASTVYNNLHAPTYSYNVPLEVMQFLIDIHQRSETIAPYNRNAATWFKEKFTKNFTFVTDQAGNNATPVIREQQTKVVGFFTGGSDVPREEPEGENSGGWTTQLTYKFWADIPEEMVLNFPLMTHQQCLSAKYINYDLPAWVDTLRSNKSLSAQIYHHFDSNYQGPHPLDITPGVPIPTVDDWQRPKLLSPQYMDVFRILIQFEENNPLICNLRELGEFAFLPTFMEYISKTYSKMTGALYRNIFHCTVWRWNELQGYNEVRVDKDLNVYFDGPVNLRDNYHLVISMLIDPSLLTDDAIKDLGLSSCLVYEYLSKLFPTILPKLMDNPDGTCKEIPPGFIKDIIREVDKEHNLVNYPRAMLPVTVGQFTIEAGVL